MCLVGCRVRGQELREWQWVCAQPDGGRDQRVPLGAARHAGAGAGQLLVGVAWRPRCSSRRARVFPPVGAAEIRRTRSDEGRDHQPGHLGKRYRIGEYQAGCGTLRESLSAAAKRVAGGHGRPRRRSGRFATSRSTCRRARSSASSAATAPASRTLLKVLSRITEPTGGRAEIRGRVGEPARGRHRLSPRAHRPREHLPERRHPRHEAREIHAASSTRSSSSPGSGSSSTRR